MKKKIRISVFKLFSFVCLTFPFQSISQSNCNCDVERFEDNKIGNEKFDQLIMKACEEYNSKDSKLKGYNHLGEALNSIPVDQRSLFLMGQYERAWRYCLIDQNLLSESEKNKELIELPPPQPDLKIAEEKEIQPKPEPVLVEEVATVESKLEETDLGNLIANMEAPKKKETIESFSQDELEDFKLKGIQKVKQLESTIAQIGSKNTSPEIANQAIENALELFDSENRSVQVSNLHSEKTMIFKIRPYLNRVKNYSYDKVEITWADFLFTSNFIKAPDGTYHGYISFIQRFSGLKDNNVVYSDITEKKQLVILKQYRKAVEGDDLLKWDVFLGDINVVATRAN